jgi:chromosome segregation ATPase
MNHSKLILLILIVVSAGVWGCARQAGSSPGLARLRDLEDRNAKLERDYQAVLKQRDQTRADLATLSEKCANLSTEVDQLRAVAQERDDLRRQVAALTTERNNVQTTLTQFTKELQQLLGRMESTTANAPAPGATQPAAASLAPPVATEALVVELPNKS